MNDCLTTHCERCSRRLGVLNTKRIGETRVQYIGCRRCGYRPPDNKRVWQEATRIATTRDDTAGRAHKMTGGGATMQLPMNRSLEMLIASPRPLTLNEVAERRQVDPRTVQRWVKQNQFPAPMRNGRTARWSLLRLMHHEAHHAFGAPVRRSRIATVRATNSALQLPAIKPRCTTSTPHCCI